MKRRTLSLADQREVLFKAGAIMMVLGLGLIFCPDIPFLRDAGPDVQSGIGVMCMCLGLLLFVLGLFVRQFNAFGERMEHLKWQRAVRELPEASLVTSVEQREAVVRATLAAFHGKRASGVRLSPRWGRVLLFGVGLGVPIAFAFPALTRFLSSVLPYEFAMMTALILLLYGPLVVWATWHRKKRLPRFLREQLIAANVPVCIGCGYYLHGISSTKCPECGRELDKTVRDLIASESPVVQNQVTRNS